MPFSGPSDSFSFDLVMDGLEKGDCWTIHIIADKWEFKAASLEPELYEAPVVF